MEILGLLFLFWILKHMWKSEDSDKKSRKKRKKSSWNSGPSYSEYEQWCRDHGQKP